MIAQPWIISGGGVRKGEREREKKKERERVRKRRGKDRL